MSLVMLTLMVTVTTIGIQNKQMGGSSERNREPAEFPNGTFIRTDAASLRRQRITGAMFRCGLSADKTRGIVLDPLKSIKTIIWNAGQKGITTVDPRAHKSTKFRLPQR